MAAKFNLYGCIQEFYILEAFIPVVNDVTIQ